MYIIHNKIYEYIDISMYIIIFITIKKIITITKITIGNLIFVIKFSKSYSKFNFVIKYFVIFFKKIVKFIIPKT